MSFNGMCNEHFHPKNQINTFNQTHIWPIHREKIYSEFAEKRKCFQQTSAEWILNFYDCNINLDWISPSECPHKAIFFISWRIRRYPILSRKKFVSLGTKRNSIRFQNTQKIENRLYPTSKWEIFLNTQENRFQTIGRNPLSHIYIYICSANLLNQIFPGIPNPFRESGESLKWISSKSNV